MNTESSAKKKSKYIVLAAAACLLFFIGGLLAGRALSGKAPDNRPAGSDADISETPRLSGAPEPSAPGSSGEESEPQVTPPLTSKPSEGASGSPSPTGIPGPEPTGEAVPSSGPAADSIPDVGNDTPTPSEPAQNDSGNDTQNSSEPDGGGSSSPNPSEPAQSGSGNDENPSDSSQNGGGNGAQNPSDPAPSAGANKQENPSGGSAPSGQPTEIPKPTAASKPSPAPKPTAVPKSTPTPTPKPTPAPEDGTYTGSAAVSANGQLQVIGTQLCSASSEPIVLRGISTAGIAWFPELATRESMQTLRNEWKTSVFRIAMYSFEGDRSYIRNPEWNKTKVCSLIDAAIELDQYVIVDWHILADGNPQTYQKQAEEFFTYIASKYAGVPNLLYEICNEPNGGVSWSGNIKPYAEAIIPVIREYSPEAVILVGTPTWSQDVDAAAADPLDFDNVMYSLHFYAGTHKEWLRTKADTALGKGLPLFVTEWGTTDASGNGAVDTASTLEWLSYLDRNQISWCNWSLCNKAESSALLKTSAPTDGTMPDSALTESGKLVKKQLLERAGSETAGGDSDPAVPTKAPGTSGGGSDPAVPTKAPGTSGGGSDPAVPTKAPGTSGSGSGQGTAGGLVLEYYNENREPSANTISPRFRLKNTGSAAVSLSTVTLRYYYTPESDAEQKLWCDYAEVNGGSYRAITDTVSGSYLAGEGCMEIRFSANAGTLEAGDTAALQLRITNADWSNYDQSNDDSFCPDASTWQPAGELLTAP